MCKSCQSGHYSSFFDEKNCHPCQPGTIPDGMKVSCQLCPLGHYSPESGQQQCMRCGVNEFSNQKRTTCVTLKFERDLPELLISLVPFRLPSFRVHDAVLKLVVIPEIDLHFDIAFVCFESQNCTASSNGTLLVLQGQINQGWNANHEVEIVQRVLRSDVGDNWIIQITSQMTTEFPAMQMIMPGLIRVLGTQPKIEAVVPSLLPSAFPVLITVFGTLLDAGTLSPRCAAKCVFKRTNKGSRPEISSFSSIMNNTQSAYIVCKTNFHGSMWIEDDIKLDLQLPDCRYSTSNFNVKMVCPKRFYQSVDAVNHRCEPCPSPKSVTLQFNETSIENCICNVGFYGTFGENCKQCPNHPGFNCSIYGSTVPRIKPGKKECFGMILPFDCRTNLPF
jgi:hypothetical protein